MGIALPNLKSVSIIRALLFLIFNIAILLILHNSSAENPLRIAANNLSYSFIKKRATAKNNELAKGTAIVIAFDNDYCAKQLRKQFDPKYTLASCQTGSILNRGEIAKYIEFATQGNFNTLLVDVIFQNTPCSFNHSNDTNETLELARTIIRSSKKVPIIIPYALTGGPTQQKPQRLYDSIPTIFDKCANAGLLTDEEISYIKDSGRILFGHARIERGEVGYPFSAFEAVEPWKKVFFSANEHYNTSSRTVLVPRLRTH